MVEFFEVCMFGIVVEDFELVVEGYIGKCL